MKRIFKVLILLFIPLFSCSNQENPSQTQSEIVDKSASGSDIFPTLDQLYSKNGNSALVSANIDKVYTDILNVVGEKFIVLK